MNTQELNYFKDEVMQNLQNRLDNANDSDETALLIAVSRLTELSHVELERVCNVLCYMFVGKAHAEESNV